MFKTFRGHSPPFGMDLPAPILVLLDNRLSALEKKPSLPLLGGGGGEGSASSFGVGGALPFTLIVGLPSEPDAKPFVCAPLWFFAVVGDCCDDSLDEIFDIHDMRRGLDPLAVSVET
jgi:hypothetical protein